jgi:hypothetical protein
MEFPTPAEPFKLLVFSSYPPPTHTHTQMAGWFRRFRRYGHMFMASRTSPEPDRSKTREDNASGPTVQSCEYLLIRCTDTVNTMRDLNPFYIKKALNQIGWWPLKNDSRLRDKSLVVESWTDYQTKKVLKRKIMGSYPVVVEKYPTLNWTWGVIFRSQVAKTIDPRSDSQSKTFPEHIASIGWW